jgi:hypothetical protein
MKNDRRFRRRLTVALQEADQPVPPADEAAYLRAQNEQLQVLFEESQTRTKEAEDIEKQMQADLEETCGEGNTLEQKVDQAEKSLYELLDLNAQRALQSWPFPLRIIIGWAGREIQAAKLNLSSVDQLLVSVFIGISCAVFPLPGFGLVLASILQGLFGGNAAVTLGIVLLSTPLAGMSTLKFMQIGSIFSLITARPFMLEDLIIDPIGSLRLLIGVALLPWICSSALLLCVVMPVARSLVAVAPKTNDETQGHNEGEG